MIYKHLSEIRELNLSSTWKSLVRSLEIKIVKLYIAALLINN